VKEREREREREREVGIHIHRGEVVMKKTRRCGRSGYGDDDDNKWKARRGRW